MKTIIYAHPYDGSYNHAILTQLTENFDRQHDDYQIIDLYKDAFNPAFTKEELRLFGRGESVDPLVKKYQNMIKDSNELIFIFPIWWYNVPAIVKGFLDKVMLKGFAYDEDERANTFGKLSYIKKATVITTSTVTKDYLINESGDPIQGMLINRVFDDLNFDTNTKWIHFGQVNTTTDENRELFLKQLPDIYNGNDSKES